jgi:hypothetical protein
VIDPRGITVVCYRSIWDNHILEHSAMENNEQAVINTLVSPDVIYGSGDYPNRDVYFKIRSGAAFGEKLYIKAVVEINNNAGVLITAFPIIHIRR